MLPINNRLLVVKFWGVESYMQIFTCMGMSSLKTLELFKGQLYFEISFILIITSF